MSSHCQLYALRSFSLFSFDFAKHFLSFFVVLESVGQPKIRKSLTDVEVAEKENLLLEVEVYAVPEPKIVWFRDGQEVRSDARIKIQRDNVRSETYNLTLNMIKRDEAGVYEMKATNTLGTAVTKSVVIVNSECKGLRYCVPYFFVVVFQILEGNQFSMFIVRYLLCKNDQQIKKEMPKINDGTVVSCRFPFL